MLSNSALFQVRLRSSSLKLDSILSIILFVASSAASPTRALRSAPTNPDVNLAIFNRSNLPSSLSLHINTCRSDLTLNRYGLFNQKQELVSESASFSPLRTIGETSTRYYEHWCIDRSKEISNSLTDQFF